MLNLLKFVMLRLPRWVSYEAIKKKGGGGAGFALIPELQELTATVLR